MLIQPPMPTVEPSAMASAAARQCNCGACLTARSWSCEKQYESQRKAERLSLRRWISCLEGSARRIHCGACEGGMRDTSALLEIFWEPTSKSWVPIVSHMPSGCFAIVACGESASRRHANLLRALGEVSHGHCEGLCREGPCMAADVRSCWWPT